ncbi:MAG TPA: hypothetical protein VMS99_13265 [Acidimicrobiia bacterium]|nr:hypothetical protein [Acidimicrobiia bacterium]
MKNESVFWVLAAAVGGGIGFLVAFGASGAAVVVMVIIAALLISALGRTMRRDVDAAWLAKWVTLGFFAKIAGTVARYYMVKFYGAGDSLRYYSEAVRMAETWRRGEVPPLSGSGSLGTQVVEAVTGGLFAIATPSLLGGFALFAIISYLGQLGLYAAFRRWAKPHQLKAYAFLVLFLPTYAFWPSTIGKDALVLLFIGIAAYSISRLLEGFELRWVLPVGLALGGLGLIRIHVAALVSLALVGTVIISKLRIGSGFLAKGRKLITFAGAAAAVVLAISLIPDIVGLDLATTGDIVPFTDEITRRTSEDGTVASGNPVRSVFDVPAALALVLFRPFVFEATEVQHLLAAAETSLILLLTVWKLPAMIRNGGRWRSNAYLVFCTLYTLGFAIVFSVVRNLGIIARQRGQVLAFFLAVVIGLGWNESRKAIRQRKEAETMMSEPDLTGMAVHR